MIEAQLQHRAATSGYGRKPRSEVSKRTKLSNIRGEWGFQPFTQGDLLREMSEVLDLDFQTLRVEFDKVPK